jgi:hypothetical protein
MTDSLNPLPEADTYANSQRKSFNKFKALLPENLFVFRDEPSDDAGVDGSLEILVGGKYTNMRAQVQLKSRQKKKAKKDESITFPIKTSNLNYLLNGLLGLYVLYIGETDELFYAWANDENRRRIEVGSEWKNQSEISIPFQELNKLALKDIYERILSEYELRRKILETLAHAPSNDNICISINSDTLKSENSIEIKNVLGSAGMTLVAAGYSNIVLEKLSLISQKSCIDPRFKLISSYANFSLGKYQKALGESTDVIIFNNLQDEDKRFAERIHLACRLNLGMITSEEYYQELASKESSDECLYIEAKLQKLIDQFRSSRVRDENILDEINEIKNKVLTSNIFPDSLKFSARVKCLEITGFDSIRNIFDEIITILAKNHNQKITLTSLEVWNSEADDLIQYAITIGHPIFIADAFTSKAFIKLLLLTSSIFLLEFQEQNINQESLNTDVLEILNLCNQSFEIYKKSKMLEGEVRIQLIMSQAFEVKGQEDSAKNLAEGILDKAIYLGYKRHEETAKEVIAGNSWFAKTMQSIQVILQEKISGVYDILTLSTDKEMESYVDEVLNLYKLPQERRENIVIAARCFRDNNIEKNKFCRHIQILEDLSHTSSPLSLFAENPNRCIQCLKFKSYLVNDFSPDWINQITKFKEKYCSICHSQEPVIIE